MKFNKCFLKIFLGLGLVLITSCSQKEKLIIKNNFIEANYPTLEIYKPINRLKISVKLVGVGNDKKVCVKNWDGCIKYGEFFRLKKYINNLKTKIKKYESQIKSYNDFIKNKKRGKMK